MGTGAGGRAAGVGDARGGATSSPDAANGAGSARGILGAGGRASAGRTASAGRAGECTGRAAVASVSRGFMRGGGIEGPSGTEPRVVPPSGSAGTAGMRSLGGSGVDQVRGGEVGACSTLGEGSGGGGTGAAGGGGEATGGGGTGAAGGGVAIAGLGGSGDAAGAGGSGDAVGDRGSGAGSGAAGVSTREGATRLGCATGVDGADSGGAASLSRLGDPCAGKTSRALIPGGTLTSQAMRPSTTTWTASEPDMQMPRVTAGEPRPVSMGKGSGCPWEAGPGSVMSPLLPRVPAFAYGLLRVSGSPPTRLRVSPRSGEPASAGLETGTSRSATEAGDATGSVPTAAGGVARSTPASLGEFAVGGGSERLRAPAASGKTPTAMWRSAGGPSANPALAPPPTTSEHARSDPKKRPVTEPV